LNSVHQLQNLYFAIAGEELIQGGNKWAGINKVA
jgi:hypothetical protein